MSRVAVFVDYQNMYHGARRAFGAPTADAPSFGHVDPAALARLLADLGRAVDPGRVLVATSVYRGEPGRLSHRKLRTSFARQTSRWRTAPTLVPALDEAMRVGKRVETAAWFKPETGSAALRVSGRRVWNHRLDHDHFTLVQDTTDYLARR